MLYGRCLGVGITWKRTFEFPILALDLTNNHIYCAEIGFSRIRRANLDGTNPVNLITGVNDGQGIALQIASSTTSGTQNIRYVPIKSEYVLLVLIAVLGGWFVLRKR